MNRPPPLWPEWILYFLVSLAAGALMVSTQSLWIDEGETWTFARQPTFKDWLTTLLTNTKGEAHTPLGMFSLWLSGRIFGQAEWQLRALNGLWVAIGGVAVGRLGRILGRRELLPLFLAHPFLWYYANEARVYALVICLSAWLLFLWVSVHETGALGTGRVWAIGWVCTLGLASSLLFGFALMGFALAFGATILAKKIRLDRRHLIPMAVIVLIMVPVIAYYLWTLSRGASAAKLWKVGASNVVFALYELLGFGGLGPPRHELRELAKSAGLTGVLNNARYVIGIAVLAGVYLALLRPFWRLRRDSLGMIATGAVVLSSGIMFVASMRAGFPFWGRHLAYLLPLVVLLVVRAASQIGDKFWRRCLVLLLVLVLLVSSLCQRFLPNYGKDDYRSASRMAAAALGSGKTVWWVADHVIARYYGLEAPATQTSAGRLIWFNVENERNTRNKPAPDLIFVSKPDVHDSDKNVMSYINEHGYRTSVELVAFRIYTRSGRQD
jgi:hypothetical protein